MKLSMLDALVSHWLHVVFLALFCLVSGLTKQNVSSEYTTLNILLLVHTALTCFYEVPVCNIYIYPV
jgi:hypothetical protein